MLIGVSPVISPELISVLHRMGHGDELVLSDAFYPGDSCNARVLRADGIKIPALLDGILRLINIDPYVNDPLVMMNAAKGDTLDPAVEASYIKAIKNIYPDAPAITRIDRFTFYERSKSAFAVHRIPENSRHGFQAVLPRRPHDDNIQHIALRLIWSCDGSPDAGIPLGSRTILLSIFTNTSKPARATISTATKISFLS